MRPRDEADVAEILASTTGALEPVGGGSKRTIGRPVAAQPLDLSALAGVLDYEPDELVLTARAATPIAQIETLLGTRAQCLAFEPPDWSALLGTAPAATLGGVVASNACGPRRLSAGAARDHFLGFRAVSGRGERFRGGGRVVKNVTGYDLPKLLAGSWGTLAILTELTVRVHPAPEEERTLLIENVDLAAALALIGAALGSACAISGAAFVPARGAALRLEGFSRSVHARAQDLLELLRPREAHWLEVQASRALWREIGAVEMLAGHEIVWRLSVPPSDAQHLIEQLAPAAYLLDWGGGLLWMAFASAAPERVRGALRSGHARLVKAPVAVRATTAVFHPLPEALSVSARLKAAFDPQLRLNPGRLD